MNFLDNHHIVKGWASANITGGNTTSDCVSLKNWNHATFVLVFAATDAGADVDILVQACNDVAGSQTASVANMVVRKSAATTSDDVFGTAVEITDSKVDYVAAGDIVPDTDDNKIVVIDVKAEDVKKASSTYNMDCVRLYFPNPAQNCTVGCLIILSEPRYAAATMPSAIID